ncbi:hypothetical protein PPL_11688 [Heterostelium album PN500]|uniref:KANL2-like probable zinc-finger domain-containing protein n=1 Tax=Heterostelium pallidum (strain ATCC 26659 / Pp 5 / PN500) TaxID=670386 RepID=D3BU69_HETP5|nr:hypothetical protein PPL_11688 [Heterostelium album PN500]EFA75003.1 hypothetical protein PPL_11688 [Heterostelium album PN500]|eukprot:XP_020427137.1 hypothetical protein PPL_11688 [Heterostelium album PN500]
MNGNNKNEIIDYKNKENQDYYDGEEEEEELPLNFTRGRRANNIVGHNHSNNDISHMIDINTSVVISANDHDDEEEEDGEEEEDDDDEESYDYDESQSVRSDESPFTPTTQQLKKKSGRGSGSNHSRSRRPLRAMCASIKKACSKRPMEGRLYCSKHILEDPTAPYAQCEFVSSKSMKRCTAPVSLRETTPRYCPTHKHMVVSQLQKKRTLEDSNSTSSSQSKRLLAILAKHGINKGNYYQDYKNKELNNKRLKIPTLDDIQQTEINESESSSTTTTTTTTTSTSTTIATATTTTTTTTTPFNNHMDASKYYKFESIQSNKWLDSQLLEPKDNDDWHLCDDFNEDFYLAQTSLLSEEELVQRRKIYISKLILLYKKQYTRIKERLRILRRHYLESVLNDNQNNNNQNNNNQNNQSLCSHSGCKVYPLPLSKYCYAHILDDSQQKLFTGCNYQLINDQRCGYPILKTQIPDLCLDHLDVIAQQDSLFINGKIPKKKQLKSLLQQQAQQLKKLSPNTYISISNQNTPMQLTLSDNYGNNYMTTPFSTSTSPSSSSTPSSPLFKSTGKSYPPIPSKPSSKVIYKESTRKYI